MGLIILSGILLIIIGVLVYRLIKKQQVDKQELSQYLAELNNVECILNTRKEELQQAAAQLQYLEEQKHSQEIQIETLKSSHQTLKTTQENEFQARKKELEIRTKLIADSEEQRCADQIIALRKNLEKVAAECDESKKQVHEALRQQQDYYNSILEPIRALQLGQWDKQKYCIELSDNDIQDIDYLLNAVSPRINNQDALGRIIWTVYVQKPLNEVLKKFGIEDVPGIYKLTNLKDGRCYIGKSTTVKTRIQNHFKGACGINTISDQKIHHEMRREGLNNWMIECITTCPKEELGEKEKYYIEFFNSRNYGYNIAIGG